MGQDEAENEKEKSRLRYSSGRTEGDITQKQQSKLNRSGLSFT